jgi:hypothetical protein
MAVTTLPRAHSRRAHSIATTLPPIVLAATLLAPALDLLALVQTSLVLTVPAVAAATLAAGVLALSWARYPRTSWLGAAVLAATVSVAMRVLGAEVAPLLSLMAVLAVGIGGGFATPSRELESYLEAQPTVPSTAPAAAQAAVQPSVARR